VERQARLGVIRARLEQVATTGDLAPVLEPAALAEARRLAEILENDQGDMEVRYLLGWLHWYRHQALPEAQHPRDRETAVGMFTYCFIDGAGADHLPEVLLPVLAEQAFPVASRLLEEAAGYSDHDAISHVADLWQRILDVTPFDHPDRAMMLSNLGIALRSLSGCTEALTDLDAAVKAGLAAVEMTPRLDPCRAKYLSNVAGSLRSRFERTGVQTDLDAAIKALESAAKVTPVDLYDRVVILSNLGGALWDRFLLTGTLVDLNAAVENGRAAVETAPMDHPNRAMFLYSLGIALHLRADRISMHEDLEASIAALEAAVEAAPTGHPDRPMFLSNLGIALRSRFERTGALADLDAAVENGRTAVETTPTNHPSRPRFLSNLGITLRSRFERTGALADLDAAVEAGQAAVKATSTDHPDRGKALTNLVGALHLRFERTGALADLDAAIEAGRAAVEAISVDHRNRAMALSNLGGALQGRFERTGALADLDAAIEAGRAAVEAIPSDHPDLALFLSNLALALHRRFDRTEALADLNAAVEAGRVAVQTTPTDHSGRAYRLSSLGDALLSRFEHSGAQTDLAAASAAFTQALEIDSAAPSVHIRAASALASLVARSEPGRAAGLLETAVRMLPEMTPRRLERSDQQIVLGGLAGLAGDAAALALADGQTARDERAEKALRLLEAGRSVLLSQALDTRSDLTELKKHHPHLATRFTDLRDRLDQSYDAPLAVAMLHNDMHNTALSGSLTVEDRARLADEFTAILTRIRSLEGFASFAHPPTIDELLAQAEGGPVVNFNISSYRSDALLLTEHGITSLPLPNLTPDSLVKRIWAFHGSLYSTVDPDSRLRDRRAAQRMLREILEWLWDTAMEPVLQTLGYHDHPPTNGHWPRVWWVPGGLLGLLPLHAAGYHTDPATKQDRRTVMDRVVSSYTPTIRALRYARQRTTTPVGADRALIVAMPTTPGVLGRLQHVSAEASMLHARLPKSILLTEPDSPNEYQTVAAAHLPTKANVLAHLPGCPIVHFACHGASHPTDPSQSLLLLRDHEHDPLDVASLGPVKLDQAQLAYLSACRTAFTGALELLDEAIHLASAFQLAGFPHVIGTLWEIDDAHAVEIADTFYTVLNTGDGTFDVSRAAYALHHAVRTVRDKLPDTPSLWAAHLHAGA
jgi:tetratricopeptide (TPR) repeat protein